MVLGLAACFYALLAVEPFEWKRLLLGVVCSLGGAALLWKSASAPGAPAQARQEKA
jgi:hypothetical protein